MIVYAVGHSSEGQESLIAECNTFFRGLSFGDLPVIDPLPKRWDSHGCSVVSERPRDFATAPILLMRVTVELV